MKKIHKLIVPLLLATAGLVAIFMLPIRAGTSEVMIEAARAAENNPSGLSEMSLGAQTVVLSGTDVALSGTGGRLPEVAANGTFVAVVYEQNGSVYIRSVKASVGEWQPARLIASQAYVPKLAFRQGSTNTVHVVWVGDNTGKYIRHVPCTLADSGPTCPSDHISTIATAVSNLKQPDVAVDDEDRVHVAWFDDNDDEIKTAYSTNALDSSPTWNLGPNPPVLVDGGSNAGQPALAAAGAYVHLALKDLNGSYWGIEYYRLSKTNHTRDTSKAWEAPDGVNGYEEMNYPTIAATGTNVYLAWDNQQNPTDTVYGLVGVESTNSGGLWGLAKHITSTNLATETAVTADEKLSEGTGVPTIEEALRPSLAITASNKFAIVWQQQPEPDCNQEPPGGGPKQNGTSEIFFASPHDSWATSGMLADNRSEYSIDPDIAVDANGTHIVFMKADDAGLCYGGGEGGYRVYYRGPFTAVSQGGVYLPIILKNSS